MTVTIIAKNEFLGNVDKLENVDYDIVSIKEINKRNGKTLTDVRVKRGKRDIVFSSGYYNEITIQEETTGRYLMKYSR